AMLPTKGNEDAEQIACLIHQIIKLSHLANLNILSFGTDGTRSEFNAQSIITNEASNFLEYKDSFYKIHFKAPLYNNKLFIRIQNPKHAKKTARNQIFSCARLLSLGISTHFLLKHDVLNVDKQDDGAALHTFYSKFKPKSAHREFYSRFSLLPREHGTEALEQIFEIS
ncbi:21526_t:CDS:2, partial [Gigaspora rosea]